MSRKILRWLLPAIITIAGLVFALLKTDAAQLSQAFLTVTPGQILTLTLILIGGSLLAGLRLWYVADDSGHYISLRDAMAAMAIGQVAGAVTFQFFGQIAGRSLYMQRRGVQLPANIAMVGYERVVALVVSLSFALAGALYLFGQVILDTADGGLGLLKTLVGLAVMGLAGLFGGWGQQAVAVVKAHLTFVNVLRIGRVILLTVAIQSVTALSYVSATLFIFPGIPLLSLIAASTIVMFASAIPISLSGWGIREVSAVYALSVIGVPPAAAIVVAVIIGVLSLLVMVLIASIMAIIPQAPANSERGSAGTSFNITSAIVWASALISAMLVNVQIRAPTATGFININPADPFVILSGMMFAYTVYGNRLPAWRVPGLHWYLLACTAAIWFGVGVAFVRFGVSDWALYNKGFGFFLLLCYFATGAMIVLHSPEGCRLLLRTFVVCTLAAALTDLFLFVLSSKFVRLSEAFWHLPLEGFTQNRNAFAFEILLAISCVQFLPERLRGFVVGTFLVTLLYTGSRAGYLAAIVFAILAWRVSWRQAPIMIVTIVILFLVIPPTFLTLDVTFSTTDASAKQHIQTVYEGLAIFWERPLFGSGIGKYILDQNGALQIHSTPVWLLAEIGIIGFTPFALLCIVVLRSANLAIFGIIGAFAVMSLAHELLYQRALWLVLGALLTQRCDGLHDQSNSRASGFR